MQIDVDIIVYACTTIAAISTAGGLILKGLRKSLKKTTEEVLHEEMQAYTANFDDKLEKLDIQLKHFIANQETSNEQMRKSLLSSTRDRINQAHDYYTRKKFIGAHSLFVVEELYASYKQLGGNSFVDRQMEDIRELEVRSAETEESKF